MTSLLDKPFGSKRPEQQLARNREAARLLQEGKLEPGQLYRIVTGSTPEADPINLNPVLASGLRTRCKDCKYELEWAGPPLASQPRRCVPCGQTKRRAHNQAIAEKKRKAKEEGIQE